MMIHIEKLIDGFKRFRHDSYEENRVLSRMSGELLCYNPDRNHFESVR